MRTATTVSDRRLRLNPTPGWAEIVVGLLVMAMVSYGFGSQIHRLGLHPTANGLVFASLSGVAGLLSFLVAASLRVRDLPAFGIRGTTRRWLLIAVGVGVAAVIAKLALWAVTAQSLQGSSHVQDVYVAGGRGGTGALVLATALLGILTPVGEEFLFRGVVTTALLRYGAPIAVVGSAFVFALMHGINAILPVALIEGLLAAEVYRRSGSIWTAVGVHVVYNLPSVPLMVLSAGA